MEHRLILQDGPCVPHWKLDEIYREVVARTLEHPSTSTPVLPWWVGGLCAQLPVASLASP